MSIPSVFCLYIHIVLQFVVFQYFGSDSQSENHIDKQSLTTKSGMEWEA